MRLLFSILICGLFCLPVFSNASDMVVSGTDKPEEDGIVRILVTGEDRPVTVEKGENLILQAAEKIILKHGTKVVAGGSLQATIVKSDIRSLKKKEQERPLEITQTEQEKLEEQNCLEVASTLISPFVSNKPNLFQKKSEEKECIDLQSPGSSGIPVESQRRVALESRILCTYPNIHSYSIPVCTCASPSLTGSVLRVLRL
ncbi:MAG: hypothetical protein V2B15_06240 [Bacteroidota bacterium]